MNRRPGSLLFAAAIGAFLALALLKFGNPVILDYKLDAPSQFWEFLIWSWPVAWAYPLVAILLLWSLGVAAVAGRASRTAAPTKATVPPPFGFRSLVPWLPLAWFVWQCLSATQTVHWPLTQATLKHFAAATACFYIGFLALSRVQDLRPMWLLLLAGLVGVIAVGLEQHFGGLEETRRFIYSQPDWQQRSPEFLKKIASDRIYATLFYPNALAGALLLFVPPALALAFAWPVGRGTRAAGGGSGASGPSGTPHSPKAASLRDCGHGDAKPPGFVLDGLPRALGVLVGVGGMACLYWSGSKAGWLIGMCVALIAWGHSRVAPKVKYIVMGMCLVGGLTLFAAKHAAYFGGGAKSVSARLDYWNVAVKIAQKHPVLGSGPGTFSVLYRYLKPPEAEMTRLVHNDYLEQASDSGLIGFLLYSAFVVGSLLLLRSLPRRGQVAADETDARLGHADWTSGCLPFAVWLGLVGWAVQGLVEFGLYIPAVAWPTFLLLGWLWGRTRRNPFDSTHPLS